ncbi:hypothetical protein V496_09060 [Pseudogymnoascus sp. VKM F-4515 (FW-2607)]|nr:hypothetical protein V496_09060 [Pseudogymnoascus sp. VKM F-4515 (FW-2607)]
MGQRRGVQTTLAYERAQQGAGYALGNALASNWWTGGVESWHRIRSSGPSRAFTGTGTTFLDLLGETSAESNSNCRRIEEKISEPILGEVPHTYLHVDE